MRASLLYSYSGGRTLRYLRQSRLSTLRATTSPQPVRVLLERTTREEPDSDPQRELRSVGWGLLPAWAKDRKMVSKLINARSETVTEKPPFRSSAAKRRAIIPANGCYEWMKSEDGKKIPLPD